MNGTVFRLYLFILAFAPLAFGTVEHWSILTVQLLSGLLLILCLTGLVQTKEPVLTVPGILPLVLLIGLMVLQLVPLPASIIKIISPASWEAYRPFYELSGGDSCMPITVNQKATLQEILRIGSYGSFYILTVQLLRTSARIRFTLKFVSFLAAGIALIAILQQFSSAGLIYWFRLAPGGHPGGPWENVSQYTASVALLSPLVLASFFFYRPTVVRDANWRTRFVALFSSPASNLYLLLGFSFVLLVFSVFLSLHREGIQTILASMVIFATLLGHKRRNYGRTGFWAILCLVFLAVSWFGWQPIINEFDLAFYGSGAVGDARFQLWGDTLAIIYDYPLFGSGFGTFVDVYPPYETITAYRHFEHAHNDYLELLAGGGMIGFLLSAWFCGAVLVHGWRKIVTRQDRLVVLVGTGSIVGIVALLMHSMVNSNLQNGALGLHFFFLCGVLVAVVNNRYQHYTEESLLPHMSRRQGRFSALAASFYLVIVVICQFGILVAAHSYSQIAAINISKNLSPEMAQRLDKTLNTSMHYDPFEGFYPSQRSSAALAHNHREHAFAYALAAARRQPMNGEFIQRLAALLPPENEAEAELLMREGYRRAIDKNRLALYWAEWLLKRDQRGRAIEVLSGRLSEHGELLEQTVPLLETWNFSREEVAEILPDSPQTWIHYGEYQEKAGHAEESLFFRNGALEFLDQQEEIKADWFIQLISYYRRHGQSDRAVEVVRRGIDYLPAYAPFRIWLGDWYRTEGITYRAREEYERAVILDPGNKNYRAKLRKLERDIEFGGS